MEEVSEEAEDDPEDGFEEVGVEDGVDLSWLLELLSSSFSVSFSNAGSRFSIFVSSSSTFLRSSKSSSIAFFTSISALSRLSTRH